MAKIKVERAAFVTCGKCQEEHLLSSITVLSVGTNDYEEDMVDYDCPDCKKRNRSIIWTRMV